MHKPRRKKILLLLLCFLILLLGLGYMYWYPLIRAYQYSKLRSLKCEPINGSSEDCLSRIWVHRVNSIERFDIVRDKFQGFETDIVYDDSAGTFWVYHPPKPENKELLSLESFLKHVKLDFGRRLWLDTRGVDSLNMYRALKVLKKLVDTTRIRYGVIVELYDIPTARFFGENEFLTSLNVSEDLQKRLITNKALSDSLFPVLKEVHFVSQDYQYIPNLRRFFPDKSIITWRSDFEVFTDPKKLQAILDDNNVFIVLVSIKSGYYR